MATDWRKWKAAIDRYARRHGMTPTKGWNPRSARCGKACRKMIKRTKAAMHLPWDHPKPRPWRRYTDRFTYALEQRLVPWLPVKRPAWRVQARSWMALTCKYAAAWHYGQYRPGDLSWIPGQSITTDCSMGVIFLSRQAGMRDPSGYGFNGYGNTTSIIANLRGRALRSPSDLHVGDLVCWSGHVCMVYARGSDPLLWSHGMEAGPVLIRLSVERRYHAGTPLYLPSAPAA